MEKKNSIVVRLTLMVFILLFLTIAILLILVNAQMDSHFSHYLEMNMPMQDMMGMGTHGMMPGAAEANYISAVHRSLIWVGLGMIAFSVVISYFVIRAVMQPLSTLTEAVRKVKGGTYGQTVPVERCDEVGLLTQTFNDMSAELEKDDKMRRQLFANIAHELRTPLAILQGNLEGMVDDVLPMDKQTLLSMEDEVLRLSRLVQELRDLSLAEVNELPLHKEKANLNTLLTRAVSMLQPLWEEKNLHLHFTPAPDLPDITMDKDRINQVIYNLLTNAIRYIGEGCTINLSTSCTEVDGKAYVQTVIADNGPGIAAEDLPHIFQYFYRGEKSRSRKSGGSGIGLALAQQFVRSHGGAIRVDSKKGKGTTFAFILPLS